jgi:phenylacetate-coenzyme A ligase PaaK-like adenylate-forming protein
MLVFAARSLALNRIRKMDPARVAEIQSRRLRDLVRHAVERAPFYREKYRGIDPQRFDLADLPPTNKGELMANFDRAVTDPSIRRADLERFVDDPANEGRLFLDRYVPSHTSGSQGQPMLMVQERRTLELMFGLQMTRGKSGEVSVREAARRFLSPARLAIVTLKKGFYPSASTFEYMPAVARRFVRVLRLSQTDDDAVERLNAFRPTALTAYAGVLEMLALEALSGRLRLAPELKQVVNNSEVLTDRARERIEAAFGLHVMNNYATGECPFLSSGCTTDPGAHVNADLAILEVVDEDYCPVPDGTPGRRVLITNLANRLQPFIRYEVGDVVTMAATPCRCGSRLPRVAHIEGRSADTFWIRDGSRHRQVINSVFKNAFDYTREVREWQAVQTDRNRVCVRLEILPGATLDEPHARAALDRQLAMYQFQGVVDVTLEVVPRLSADPNTGKFRRMVSLVGPPDDLPSEPSTNLRFDAPESAPVPAHLGEKARARREA